MKRGLTMILTLAMLLALAAPVLAEESYEPHLTISFGTSSAIADESYKEQYFYNYVQDKFNVDLAMYSSSADFVAMTNLWIATGDMPDLMIADGDLIGLMDYADQGLLAALPDGWKENYPHLAGEFAATEAEAYVTLNGKIYALPRVVYSPNFAVPFSNPLGHSTVYYRTDWAKKLGFEIGEMTTWEELAKYIRAAVETNPEEAANIYGIVGPSGQIVSQFVGTVEPYFDGMYEKDGVFVLGAANPNVVSAIQQMKDFYDEGLIAPDFYSMAWQDARNLWAVGSAVVFCYTGQPAGNGFQNTITELINNNEHVEDADAAGNVNILSPVDGAYHFTWASTWFRALVFNPALEKNQEKFARILSILDYFATQDGVMTLRLGEKGVNWEYDDEGYPYVIEPFTYSNLLYGVMPSSQDAIGYGFNPAVPKWASERSTRQMQAKLEYLSENQPTYESYLKFSMNAGDNKNAFKSIAWSDEIIRIVLAGDVDVEAEWNNFLEANKGLWQPLLDELNAK